MCSFLICHCHHKTSPKIHDRLIPRGPDVSNTVTVNDYNFTHHLLHITGEKKLQPFLDDQNQIVCLYNGEIYNYKDFNPDYQSDGECLIPLYQEYGTDFIQKLDGEFAICLFDFQKKIYILSTDIFATKPIWFCIQDEIGRAHV